MAGKYTGKATLKYDARGRLVQNKRKSAPTKFLLFYLIPYLIINGIILMLVIASPKIETSEPDTKDYNTSTVYVDVNSLLPLRSLTATIGGIPVELTKENGRYTAVVDANGTLTITAIALNGMQRTTYLPINLLDETPPVIDEDSVYLESGILEFNVDDTQSGIDFDSIYGIDGDGDNIKPTDINRETNHITFSLKSDSMRVFVSDLSGNQLSANFSLN